MKAENKKNVKRRRANFSIRRRVMARGPKAAEKRRFPQAAGLFSSPARKNYPPRALHSFRFPF
jgi:hypothetical protein